MASRVEKSAHVLPALCPGPWKVVAVHIGVIVVWRCENCGTEWMVYKPPTPNATP